LYARLPSLILGFHGCDKSVAESLFAGASDLKPSRNDYDWLGHGVYFWESNPRRALDYARLLKEHPRNSAPKIRDPAVVGAAIDLGYCLNLLDAQFIKALREAYDDLETASKAADRPLPVNKCVGGSQDLLLRHLDCAVVEWAHQLRELEREQPFDSARGVFVEGEVIYPGAGVHEFNHVQVCVRNPACIKGYFRLRGDVELV
jgi:hypothetical protein